MQIRSVMLGILRPAVLITTLCACGIGSAESNDQIEVRGIVYSDHPVDIPCEAQAADPSRPEELSGIEIVFSDEGGTELGRTSTGTLQWATLDYGCRFFADYQAALPAATRYVVEFEVPMPREHVWVEVAGDEITHQELEANGYRWDFEAMTTYVVVDPPCAFDETGCVTTTTGG